MIISDFCTLNCANCSFNDGLCYTSMPPKYRCTFDNNFYDGHHTCHLELAPVRHGKWIARKEIFSENEVEVDAIGCSVCGKSQRTYRRTPYCPNCGAKMDVEE